MTDPNPRLERWTPRHVEVARLDAVWALHERAYAGMSNPQAPEQAEAARARRNAMWTTGDGGAPHAMLHVLLEGEAPIASATTFARTIVGQAGPVGVLALSNVTVEPDRQGRGFGRRVLGDALARIDELGLAFCLFQTGLARGFYEKLGARCIDHWFFNSKAPAPKANPWFDRYVMVYPAGAPCPEGPIDLGGPAY